MGVEYHPHVKNKDPTYAWSILNFVVCPRHTDNLLNLTKTKMKKLFFTAAIVAANAFTSVAQITMEHDVYENKTTYRTPFTTGNRYYTAPLVLSKIIHNGDTLYLLAMYASAHSFSTGNHKAFIMFSDSSIYKMSGPYVDYKISGDVYGPRYKVTACEYVNDIVDKIASMNIVGGKIDYSDMFIRPKDAESFRANVIELMKK